MARNGVMKIQLVAAIALVCLIFASSTLPSVLAARATGFVGGAGGDALSSFYREVEDLSIDDQDKVMQMRDNMDAANRQLLTYDPYEHKW